MPSSVYVMYSLVPETNRQLQGLGGLGVGSLEGLYSRRDGRGEISLYHHHPPAPPSLRVGRPTENGKVAPPMFGPLTRWRLMTAAERAQLRTHGMDPRNCKRAAEIEP